MGHPSAAAEVSVIHEKHWTRSRLDEALQASWSVETGGKWLPTNRARGQCSVTALVVKDILGGDILKTDVDGYWHFYNQIDGRRWDLTMSQFETPIGYDDLPSTKEEALSDTSAEQYRLLRQRVLDWQNRSEGRMAHLRLESVVDGLPADFETMRAEARAEGYAFLDRLSKDWLPARCASIDPVKLCSPRTRTKFWLPSAASRSTPFTLMRCGCGVFMSARLFEGPVSDAKLPMPCSEGHSKGSAS
jgi:hypothetical protein